MEEYLVVELPNTVSDTAIRHTVELKRWSNLGWRVITVVGRLVYLKKSVTPDPLYNDIAQLKAMATVTESKNEQNYYGDWDYETVENGYVFYKQGKKVQPSDLLKILASEVEKQIDG